MSDRMMVEVVHTDGTTEDREIDGSLGAMQAIVGGYLEVIPVRGGRLMYVNEEGAMAHRSLPVNALASKIAGRVLVGDVFITAGDA